VLRKRFYQMIGSMGLVVLGFSFVSRAEDAASPRSIVNFTAVHGRYSLSIPWDLTKPVVKVPFKVNNQTAGLAIFQGHIKDTGQQGKAWSAAT
jgi:hypothetical protein